MKDETCVHFLQWALPQMRMQWPGFRRVYGQVCKRLTKRVKELQLDNIEQYQDYLTTHKEEWITLNRLCQVTVSRFYRDKMLFAFLASEVLPALAIHAIQQNKDTIKVWCIGSASGEEPYTVNLAWHFQCQQQFPELNLAIVTTDANVKLLDRMEQACYAYATVKNLPTAWRDEAFIIKGELYCLKPAYRGDIVRLQQDVREAVPGDCFDLILCRNLVCTYYDDALQMETMLRIQQQLRPGGALVLGIHEQLPAGITGFEAWSEKVRVFRKGETGA
ncbi:MAG: CheR family methyltransferase [Gammaproteobacteria bacterium]